MEIISVLVPLYNNDRYIESALSSLLMDRPDRIELLILDDGSTDKSLLVATNWLKVNGEKFYSSRIWSRDNRGIPATLNELVGNSTGQYLTILPADDELIPGGIDARVNVLKQSEGLFAVFGDASVIDQDGNLISESALFDYPENHVAARRWALVDSELMDLELILRWSVPGPVFLARREMYSAEEGVGNYDEKITAEDRDYYLRLIASKSLAFVDMVVANYRVHGLNVSTASATNTDIRRSVYISELKNLELFSGLNRLALYFVYIYKKSVSQFMGSSNLMLKTFFLLKAAMARFVTAIFDCLQLLRKNKAVNIALS